MDDAPTDAPERIYLQWCDDPECDTPFEEHNIHGDVLWCEDRISDSDIEYVRADIAASLRAERDALRALARKHAIHTGVCWECDSTVELDGTEHHEPNCLASPETPTP